MKERTERAKEIERERVAAACMKHMASLNAESKRPSADRESHERERG